MVGALRDRVAATDITYLPARLNFLQHPKNLARRQWGKGLRDRDFLMISIDLAEAHVAARETSTAESCLEETTPILAGWNLHWNALSAWLTFQKALEECRDFEAAALAAF